MPRWHRATDLILAARFRLPTGIPTCNNSDAAPCPLLSPSPSLPTPASRPFTLIVCPVSPTCCCTPSSVLPLAWRIPKVPHRPDFDGFIRQRPSIISSSIAHSFFSFPSPTPSAHPRACHQSLHLIIIPAPSLHHPSPLYTQPVNASSCHPPPLPCEPPPKLHHTYCHAMVLSSCSPHIRQPGHWH